MSTPWTRKAAGGALPSDRLRPSRTPTPGKGNVRKGQPSPEPRKSDRVRTLEDMLAGARSADAGAKPDPLGGCFCLARIHPLSTYTPVCTRCGLILCSLNPPYRACPSCSGSLPMLGLVQKLEEEINQALAEEEAVRIRAEEAAREAAGAFPTLQAPTPSSHAPVPTPAAPPTTRKVMSLSGGGRVKVSTYSPTPSRPHTPSSQSLAQEEEQRRRRQQEEEEQRGSRIARPPTEVVIRPQSGKRWGDGLALSGGVQYVGPGAQSASHGKGKKAKRDPPDGNHANASGSGNKGGA